MPSPQGIKETKDQLNDALLLHIKKSQWGQAIEVLGKLIKLEPANTTYLLRTGDYHAKLGAKEKAVAAYMNAGRKFSDGGFLVKGIAAYKVALQIAPNHEEIRKRLQALHLEAREQTDPRMMLQVSPPSAAPAPKSKIPTPEEIARTPEVASALGIEPTALPEAPPSAPPERLPIEPTAPAPEEGVLEEAAGERPGAEHLIERTAFETPEEAAPASEVERPEAERPIEVEATSYADPTAPPSEPIPVEPTRQDAVEEIPADPVEDLQPTALPQKHLNDVIPLFANLTPEEFSGVVEKTTSRSYAPGDFIVREGETGDSIFIIIKGGVRVTTRPEGKEIVLGTLNENDFFGEVAFLTGRPRTANVVAAGETDLLELPGSALTELLSRYPRIRGVLETFYVRRVKMTIETMKNAKGAL